MAAITPSGNADLMAEVWTESLEDAVYDLQAFVPNIRKLPKPDNKLHVRKVARQNPLYQTLAQSATGVTLTYDGVQDAAVTMVPQGIYTAASFSRNTLAQLDLNPDSPFRQNCEDAISEGVDTIALANVLSLVTSVTGDYTKLVDAGVFRYTLAALRIAAKSKAEPGKADLHAVFEGSQVQGLLGIPEFTHAHILGVTNGPSRTGIMVEAYGITVHLSNAVNSTGAGSDNPVFLKEAFGIAWNEEPVALHQTLELQDRMIVYCNFATGIIHDVRAANLRTNTQLQ